MNQAAQRHRINWKALAAVVAGLAGLVALAVVLSRGADTSGFMATAEELLEEADRRYAELAEAVVAAEAGEGAEDEGFSAVALTSKAQAARESEENALTYMQRYVDEHPDDLAAWDRFGEVLADPERLARLDTLGRAVEVNDELNLAADGDPAYRHVLFRLAELTFRDGLRGRRGSFDRAYGFASRYVTRLEEADLEPGAEAYRLLAQVQAYRARPDHPGGAVRGAEDEAIDFFERAEAIEPGDITTARILAEFFLDIRVAPERAQAVIDTMTAANPDSAEAMLVRYGFLLRRGRDYAAARDALRSALALAPDSPEVRLAAAADAIRRNDLDEARGHLDAIPESRRDTQGYLESAARVSLSLGDTEAAVRNISESLVLSGGRSAETAWRLANLLLTLGRTDEAEPLIERYTDLTADDPDQGTRLAYLEALRAWRDDRPERALEVLDGLDLDERVGLDRGFRTSALLLRGRVLADLGRDAEALDDLEAVREVSPTNTLAILTITEVQLRQGRADAARATLDEALRANPSDPGLLERRARLMIADQLGRPAASRDWSELEAFLDDCLERFPADPTWARYKAQLLAGFLGQPSGAEVFLRGRLDEHPEAGRLWIDLALLLANQGRTREALDVLAEASAVEEITDPTEVLIIRANLLANLGFFERARATLEEGLAGLAPDRRARLLRAITDLALRQDDAAGAVDALRRWQDVEPTSATPLRNMLRLALLTEDRAAAEAAFEQLEAAGEAGGDERLAEVVRIKQIFDRLDSEAGPAPADRDALAAEARELIEGLRRDAPGDPESYLVEAALSERLGDLDAAIAALQEALRREAGTIALRRLGQILARLEDRDRITRIAADVAEIAPEDPEFRLWKAAVLARIGEDALVEEDLRRILEDDPDQPDNWVRLIRVVGAEPGRRDEALELIDAMVDQFDRARSELIRAQAYAIIGERDRAAAEFERAISLTPDDIATRRQAVRFYLDANLAEEAEASLEHVLAIDPDQAWARQLLALLLSRRSYDYRAWRRALELVSTDASGDDPGAGAGTGNDADVMSVDMKMVRSNILARADDPERRAEARAVLEEILAEQPNAAGARELMARLHVEDRRYEEAAEHAVIAAERNPGARTLNLAADVLTRAGQLDAAAAYIERLEADYPDQLGTVERRARWLLARDRGDEAIELLRNAIQARQINVDRGLAGARFVRLLSETDRLAEARALVDDLFEGLPASQLVLAEELGDSGQIDTALEICRRVAAADPESVFFAAARAVEVLNQPGRTEAHLELADDLVARALEVGPEDLRTLNMAAFLRHLQGRYDEEVALYEKIDSLDPVDTRYLNNMAWTIGLYQGRLDEALSLIARAIEEVGPLADFLDTQGVLLTARGDYARAIEVLERSAAKAEPERFPVLAYHLARAYHLAGRDADYRETMTRARDAGFEPGMLDPDERRQYAQLPPL